MSASIIGGRCVVWMLIAGLLAGSSVHQSALAQAPGQAIAPALEQRFGLNEMQVRNALGALLLFARERLPKPAFADLAERIPDAESVMQNIKLSGVVTRPLDSISDYEKCLELLGIAQPLASRFAPAVVEQLKAAGFEREGDILWSVLH